MVRVSGVEPSTVEVDIVDGSVSRREPSTLKADSADGSMSNAEPSMLKVDIVDGSILQDLTFHANAPYRGWFGYQVLNLPRLVPISRMVRCPKLDLPRLGSESWTVRVSGVEPSTLRA